MPVINKNGKLIFRGEPGESLFTMGFTVPPSDMDPNELPELFKLTEKTGDDRSFALVSAIIIENRIDKLLVSLMPSYSKKFRQSDSLAETIDFFTKIKLLYALNLIPSHICDCCALVGNIRNKFAHNLDNDSFEKIDSNLINKLKTQYESIYGQIRSETNIRELFKGISFVAIVGISIYIINVRLLRQKISSGEFLKELSAESEKNLNNDLKEIHSRGPIKVEYQGKIKTERFEEGVVSVGSTERES